MVCSNTILLIIQKLIMHSRRPHIQSIADNSTDTALHIYTYIYIYIYTYTHTHTHTHTYTYDILRTVYRDTFVQWKPTRCNSNLTSLADSKHIIILDNDQRDGHLLYFTIYLLHYSTCFEHYMLIIRRMKFTDGASGIVLSVSGHPVHRTATD